MVHRVLLNALAVFILIVFSPLFAHAAGFVLASKDFQSGAVIGQPQVFNGFGCTGENHSPELHWSGAPSGTKSFLLTVHDPDAPIVSGWWHWTVFDIPGATDYLPTGVTTSSLPAGAVEGPTDFGSPGYGGPCPPPGDKPHRYVFTLYALDVSRLTVGVNPTGAMLSYLAKNHTLAQTQLVGFYGRSK